MKIVFDENVPRPLRQFLLQHESVTLQELGWAGIGNGELVRRADGVYDDPLGLARLTHRVDGVLFTLWH